jgi:hypothetical protein
MIESFAPSRCPCGLPWDDCPLKDWNKRSKR